ncbi:Intersectin 1 (SH3 domain protein) [Coemansia sp. RSA 2559]|nr:Intersectin 1 (SH3 domain protein) [Coemansia sp. RSA 2559]KAJ2853337.1 Intersectin 1 (SH3 domain protein) [Coemansia erecta]
MRAKAIYACTADNSGELTFDADDVLTNIEDSSEDGWLSGRVQRTGERGLFPVVYAELQPEAGDDFGFLRKLQSQGLLSSTMELEAFRRDLDSGILHARPAIAAKPSGLTTTVSARRAANTMTASSATTDTTSTRTATSSLYSESIETTTSSSTPSYGITNTVRPPVAYQQKPLVTHKPATSVLKPPALPSKASKPLIQSSPVVVDNNEAELARQREADAASAWEKAHLAKKPTTLSDSRDAARLISGLSANTSSSSSRLQQAQTKYERQNQFNKPEIPTKPTSVRSIPATSSVANKETETRKHDQEREEADLWEAKHGIGAKSWTKSENDASTPPVSLSNGIGTGTGFVNPASRRPPPVVPTKPLVMPRSPVSAKPAIQQRALVPTKPAFQQRAVVPTKPVNLSSPVVPPKPAAALNAASRTTTTSTRQNSYSSERTSSMTSSTLAAVSAPADPATIPTPPMLPYNSVRAATRERMQSKEDEEIVYSSDPGSIANPPALPYSAKRTAIKEQTKVYEYESHSIDNPADAPNAPSLPLRQGSRSAAEPFDPIENKMQPSPQHLISRINSGSNIHKSGGFEDSFDPFMNQSSAPTTLNSRPIPQAVSRVASSSNGPLFVRSPADGFNRTSTYHSSSSYSSSVTTTTSTDSRASIPNDARSRYAHLFTKLNKQFGKRGYLTTSEVRAVVANSRLPEDQMRHILALSDRNMDGRFGPGEFNLIMHLADTALRHDPIPDSIPVSLLHAAYSK